MSVRCLEIPRAGNVYQAVFTNNGEDTTRSFVPNSTSPEKRTCLSIFAKMNTTTKGGADTLALIARSTKLVTPYLPENVADWTEHASKVVSNVRSGFSIVKLPSAWKAFVENITFRSTFDLLATSCHAVALFIRDVISKTISSIGSIFKALVDCNDLFDTTKKFSATRELCSHASGLSDEVKSGLNSEWYEQLFKIFKYSLAAIAGLVTGFVFCTGMVLPAAVGIAVLSGTIVSAIFSVAADYVRENADYVDFKV